MGTRFAAPVSASTQASKARIRARTTMTTVPLSGTSHPSLIASGARTPVPFSQSPAVAAKQATSSQASDVQNAPKEAPIRCIILAGHALSAWPQRLPMRTALRVSALMARESMRMVLAHPVQRALSASTLQRASLAQPAASVRLPGPASCVPSGLFQMCLEQLPAALARSVRLDEPPPPPALPSSQPVPIALRARMGARIEAAATAALQAAIPRELATPTSALA